MIAELIGGILAVIGAVFLLLAGLGLIRMPDTYNRMQTGTKATTLGSFLVFLGIAIAEPGWVWKLIALIIFVFLTNPLSSHALARAAHFMGISPLLSEEQKQRTDRRCDDNPARDDLAADQDIADQGEGEK